MKMRNLTMLGVAGVTLAFPALGQQMISLGMGSSDMTPDGQTVLGSLYEADIAKYILYAWSRESGAVRLGIEPGEGAAKMSGDASVIGYGGYNVENVGGFSYNSPRGWLQATITRRWTRAGGSVNLGLIPGGSSCDYEINAPGAMSRDGRFIAGSGWINGQCGAFRAWIYDSSTQAFTRLPISITPPPAGTPSTATAAWGVSDDGNTVIGYDENYTPGGFGLQRQATVWTRSGGVWTLTHLDANGGSLGCVSRDGNVVFGKMSSYTMNQVFGTPTTTIVRWVRTGGAWVASNLQGNAGFTPLGTNAAGDRMIGEQCFWSPTVNGGEPMDLTDYLTSQGLSLGGMPIANPAGNAVHSMSDDGSKITFNVQDAGSPCLTVFPMMMADLTDPACVPPRVQFSPVSQVVPGPTSLEVVLNVFASGSWPLAYHWQKETSPGTWTDLADDNCGTVNPALYDVHSSDTMQLRLGYLDNQYPGNYRCMVTGECGSATSGVAVISTTSCGSADFNCDGDVGTDADIEAFFACLAGDCPAPPCTSTADFNGDGDVGTDADIEAFFRVLAGSQC